MLQEADACHAVETRQRVPPRIYNKMFDYLAVARPVIFSVDTPVNPVEKPVPV